MTHCIYLDESGISAQEGVSVVAGIISRGEEDLSKIEEAVDRVRQRLPAPVREDFVFRAADIYQRKRGTPAGELSEEVSRLILMDLLEVPRALMLPLVFGFARREPQATERARLLMPRLEHMLAFGDCLLAAADYMNRFAPREHASIVAEDCPDMRRLLRDLPAHLQADEVPAEWRRGINAHCLTSPVQFEPKNGPLPLQIADSCAFAIRRHIEKRAHGATLFGRLTGGARLTVDLEAPAGRELQVWRFRNLDRIHGMSQGGFPYGT